MSRDKNIGRIREGSGVPNPLDNKFIFDERKKWDFLSYVVDYMKLVRFYNQENEIEGDWSDHLYKDPIFFQSVIITTSIENLEQKARNFNQDVLTFQRRQELSKEMLVWYDTVNFWINWLTRLGEIKLADKIESMHRGVMRKYKSVMIDLLEEEEHEAGKIPFEDIQRAFLTYQKVIKYIQEISRENLIERFFASDNHSPNNALYLSFILLLERIQEKMNSFPRRHLDFYYKKVLRQIEKTGEPTKAVVAFELKPDIKFSKLDTGVKLSAGKQFGRTQDLMFGIKKPLSLYPVSIQNMFSIFLNKSPYIKAGTNDSIITNLIRYDLVKKGVELQDLRDEEVGIFGASNETANRTTQSEGNIGDLGFVISSPSLFLSEGQRIIRLHFAMDSVSADGQFWKLLREISVNHEESVRAVFNTIFKAGFNIEYTTKDAWQTIDGYKLSLDQANDTFTIEINLDISAPPVQILEGETMKWPTLKFLLNPYAPVYLYSFLKELKLRTVRIEVEVSELRNLSVYNNIGKIDINAAFDPFGPIPKIGSNLKIGKAELFKKNITDLSLQIEWDNLPEEEGGFESYFARYPNETFNNSYKAYFSVLNKGKWFPMDELLIEEEELFATKTVITPEGYEEQVLTPKSEIKFHKFRELALAKKNFNLKDPLDFTVDSLDGFIRLTLSSPEEAFGYEVYPDLVAAVSIHNARKKRNVPLPNKPFVPTINTLKLSYKAEDSINFENSKSNLESTSFNLSEFYHISPLGWHEVLKNQEVYSDLLLHDFTNEGQLYLHLNNAAGAQMLSIYFDLDDTQSNDKLPDTPPKIHFKRNEEWVELPVRNIIRDDTLGFIKSGIIELSLPAKRENALDNSVWLRISTELDAVDYPFLKGIYFNAITASCLDTDPEIMGLEIDANSIDRITGNYPDLKSVVQPKRSFGGVKRETERQFYHRIGNRLRHKDRAVTSWDFEQLVLDRFSDVQLVKCTNLDKNFKPQADKVKVIVVHKDWSVDNFHLFSRDVLFEIRDYIKSRSNAFVDLEVINPTFEFLLVNVALQMNEDARGGHYITEVNHEINKFLSPFNQVSGGFGGIGGKVVPVILTSQLEKMSFVKSSGYLSIEHIRQKGSNRYSMGIYKGNDTIKSTSPWSILVPMIEHNISVHDTTITEGIGHFQVEKDFIISKNIFGARAAAKGKLAGAWWKGQQEKEEQQKGKNEGLMVLKIKSNRNGEEK